MSFNSSCLGLMLGCNTLHQKAWQLIGIAGKCGVYSAMIFF